MSITASPPIDLADVDAFAAGRHHAMFDWLRVNDTVYWQDTGGGTGFGSRTRYADVVTGYREHMTLSSTAGTFLGGSFGSDWDTAAGRMLVSSDPPQQRNLRQVMHQVFAPHMLERVSAKVTELIDAAIDRALADGGCDFAAVARELPAGALMAMVDIPHSDAAFLIERTHAIVGTTDPVEVAGTGSERMRLAGIQADIFEYFTDLLEERRHAPGDDLVGILLRAQVNGRPMQDEEILFNCLNVAVGGNETSVYSSCTGLVTLIEHPDQYHALLTGEAALEPALDEILRWSSPNAYDSRRAKQPLEIGGKTIRAGDAVALWIVAANRDPEQFRDPHRFDITRSPNRHVAFGSGIHRCIAAAFGQTELAIVYRRMIADRIRFELDGDPTPIHSNFMLGYASVPVRVADARPR